MSDQELVITEEDYRHSSTTQHQYMNQPGDEIIILSPPQGVIYTNEQPNMVQRVEVGTSGVGLHTASHHEGVGAIENTENSVIQGNAEIIMKGQYNDAVPDLLMEGHSQQLLSKETLEQPKQEKAPPKAVQNAQVKPKVTKPKLYSGLGQTKNKAAQVNNTNVIRGRVFQINIKEEVNSFHPAVILRQSLSPPATAVGSERSKISTQGHKRRMTTTYFNETLNLQSAQQNETRFSNMDMRKNIREHVQLGLKSPSSPNQPSSPTSQKLGSPTSSSNVTKNMGLEKQPYKRTLVTQRFSNRRIANNIAFNTTQTQHSETPRDFSLPRLNLKGQEKRSNIEDKIFMSDDFSSKARAGIIIHEQKIKGDESVGFFRLGSQKLSRPTTNHMNTKNSDLITFDPQMVRHRVSASSSQFYKLKNNPQNATNSDRRLVDFDDYEVMSDDQCISNNTFNIVHTSHPYHSRKSTAQPSKAVFKVVSPQSSKGRQLKRTQIECGGHDTTENSIREANHKKELKKGLSVRGFQSEIPFFSDGMIKETSYDDINDGFRDFITLPQYFQKYEKLQKRYLNRKNENKFLRHVSVDNYLIFKQIYPRIFSIKNILKGTIEDPEVVFNPIALNQYEIFIVKSITFLHQHQYDKAQYFLDQGSIQWPTASIEFEFNQGLLAFLKGDYQNSSKINDTLLGQLQNEELQGQALNLILSVSLNLILSLALNKGKFREILLLQKKYHTFKQIKMLKLPINMKIQQLFALALQKYKLQRNLARKLKEVQEPSFRHSNNENVGMDTSRFGNEPLNNEVERSPIPSISSSITHSEEDEEVDISSSSDDQTDYSQTNRQSLSPRESKKEISYHQFKKRGNNNFPLKNLRQLDVIKAKKAAEREAKAIATNYKNLNQVFLNSGPDADKPVKKPPSPKKKYKVTKGNKACFFNIENIQDTRSPDYLMSMTEIINNLSCKSDIQENKALMYQLQKLDETVKQSIPYKTRPTDGDSKDTTEDKNPTPEQLVTDTTVPFPFQMNEIQKKEIIKFGNGLMSSGEESASPERDTKINLCMRNLEELRLEVAMSHGSELQRCDPVMNQYRIICNSIYTLLKEENLVELLKDTKKMLKNKGIRRQMFKKISIAKEILLSSLIRFDPGKMNLEAQTNDQLVEIELLQEKVKELKDIMMLEAIQQEEKGSMEYMTRLEKDIKKMLIIARKNHKERERQHKQEEEDKLVTKNPILAEQVPDSVLIETKSLSSILKRPKFHEQICEKFKVDKKKYLESLNLSHDDERIKEVGLKKSESQSLTQQVLKKFKAVDPDQFRLMMDRTKAFLRWVFDTFGGYFIAQRTYCMTEFFELAPHHVRLYFDNVSQILTNSPMRIQSLTEAFTDNEWTELCQQELIYNRDDLMFKVLSQGMRQPKCLEHLGDGKHEWQIEVIQKFNMMTILNYIMREAIKVFSESKKKSEESVDSEYLNQKAGEKISQAESRFELDPIEPLVDIDGLNAIKDQFARLKYKGAFNTLLIDKLIGSQVPMFRQFNFTMRENFYRRSHLRTLSFPHEGESFLDIEKLNKETIIVILSGNIFIQAQISEPQPMIMVEKIDKQKRRIQVMEPAGSPILKWVTKQVLGPGMAIPVQFLHWMKQKQSGQRLLIEKNLATIQNTLNTQPISIDYLEFENKELGDLIYQPIYQSLIKKVELIQNVDLFNGDSHLGASKIEKMSPYVMFIMASLFKVQVFKMSEVITQQDDTPPSMFVILDGQAKSVYQDKLERKGEVCPFSRRSIRTDLPHEMRFGMMNLSKSRSPDHSKPKMRSPVKSPANESVSQSLQDLNIFNHSPTKKGESKKMRTPKNITFQNLVYNQEWSEHQPTKKISFNHQIEFGFLTEGQYFGSRVVLDEGALRNYIKTSKEKIKDLLRAPQLAHRQTLNDRLKTGFIKANVIKPEKKAKSDSDSDNSGEVISQLSFMEDLMLQFDVDDNQKSVKDGSRIGSVGPADYEEREIQVMKNFLLKSQLSIVVASRSLQAMVMYKQDKAYFHESVKKILTEMIQEKHFIDMDRPIERNRQIDFIRSTQKQWEQYKVKNEVDALRETFHQKYEAFPR